MALITITGFPASGKSSCALQLAHFLQDKLDKDGPISHVRVVSDDLLGLSRDSYDDSCREKPARTALFSAVQRMLATDTILIVDSLNYIKGFRYQMYCAARELKLHTCTVHVVATPDLCRVWNSNRQDINAYAQNTFDNLILRFEEPSSMVRWDSPLFTVLWNDQDVPGAEVWESIVKGNIKPPNPGTLSVTKAPGDALHVLELTTTTIASAIAAASCSQPFGGFCSLPFGTSLELPQRVVTISEIQRLKRQFVAAHKKVITLGTKEQGPVDWKEENVATKFAAFVAEHFH